MGTTKETFKHNLLELQGAKSMKEVASGADIPYRTYQNMVSGVIPRAEALEKLAKYYRIPVSNLFSDGNTPAPRPPTPEEILSYLRGALDNPGVFEALKIALSTYKPKK